MKRRWIALLLIFTLAFVFVGCKKDTDSSNDPKSVTISGEAIVNGQITLQHDGEVTVTARVNPTSANQEIVWESEDPNIATVSGGKITAVSEGQTNIIAKAKAKETIKASVKVVVLGRPAAPESVSIQLTNNRVMLGGSKDLVAKVLPDNALQEVEWESTDPTVATIDENGKVTGVKLGTVTIIVKVKANPAITASVELEVVESMAEVAIHGESEVTVGKTITLMAMVIPEDYSQSVIWTSLNPSIATVDDKGVVTGLKEGEVWIIATSVEMPEIEGRKKVIVKKGQEKLPYPNLDGYVIQIMAADHDLQSHDPFHDLYTADDKAKKQEAWREIEGLMNCTLEVIPYPATAPWGQSRIDYLNNKATTNQAECDFFVAATEWVVQLASGGAALNVLEYYQKYGENAMAPGLKGAATYRGGLYAMMNPPIPGLNVDKGLYYNVGLIEQLGLDSPAAKFNAGEWSFDDFEAYVREANSKLTEGMTVLSGRPVLYYMGMANASGIPLANIVTGTLNFNHPIVVDTINLIKELYTDIGWGDIAWDASVTSFNEQRSIFQSGDWWFLKTDNRWKKDLWGEGTTKYGYVPYPWHNSKTKEDTRTTGLGGACYMQAAGRQYPAGVTAEYVYRAFTEIMLKTAEKTLEDPTFDADQKMRTAAMNRVDDPESVEAVIFFTQEKVLFDPMYELGGGTVRFTLSTAVEDVVVRGEDYAATMAEVAPTILQQLLDVYGS